jgi:class 3 adenylate cyclase
MAAVPDTHFATNAAGLRIAYQVVGTGDRDIILGQPLQAIDALWDDPPTAAALERLSRIGRLILFDAKCFGSSDPVPLGAMPSPETWMEDTRVVLDAVGSEQATLIAISSASFSPLLFAATYPQRTSGVVLVDGTARLLADDGYPGYQPEVWESLAQRVERLHGTGAVLAQFAAPSRRNDAAWLKAAGRAERMMNSPAARGALTRWIADVDVRAVLPTIRVPVLVVSHPESTASMTKHSSYLADNIAGSVLKELPGADIAFMTESADALLDVIEEFITGAPPLADDNRVLATVLFADIVGSTDRAVAMGDRRWAELLAQHDGRVRATVERFRGTLVKTIGDGAVATFDGPARGIRCAEAIRESAGQLGLEMRCGLHTGEIERYGEDIAGVGVHVAARISSLAEPDEVLASSTVKDLVVGSGIEFADRGERELKGVPGQWRLFAVQRV